MAYAEDRYAVFQANLTAIDFGAEEWDAGIWFAWIGPTIGGGFLFGLATWLPFAKVRYAWSRLLLASLTKRPETATK